MKLGRLTIQRHRELKASGAYMLVLVNGRDVTKHCVEADDLEGWALVNKVNANGQHYLENNEVARETLRGVVEFLAAD